MIFRKIHLLLLTLLSAGAGYAQMTTATLPAAEDTYVESGSTANNSASTSLYADITSTSIRRTYLKFDIASLNIPTHAVIYEANIKLPIQSEYVSPSTVATQRVTSSWSASTITYATQPTLETSDVSLVSSASGGYRLLQVTAQVQKMANMPALNLGFCVHRYNETGSARLYQYNSNENSGNKPALEIKYYVPFYVNNSTTVQHASSKTASDGAITPQLSGGPGGTISYQWYDSTGTAISGATALNLSGVGYGWYGLRISGTIGSPVYVAFIVGVNCDEVDIDFSPGPLYINDALLYERNSGTTNYSNNNYGTYNQLRLYNYNTPDWFSMRALIQFSLWMDPAFTVVQSDLLLSAESHVSAYRPNTSEVLTVTQPWLETTVTHSMGIATTATGRIELPVTLTSYEDGVIDMKKHWELWKEDNTQNYGFLMQLTSYDNALPTRRAYYSSDGGDSVLPHIAFRLSLPPAAMDLVAYNYFDALGTGWSYTVGTPTYAGTGSSGADVTGVKTFDNNKVLSKSYSTNNTTGQRASTNTVTFSNVTGLGGYDELAFEFDLASLGTGTDAGNDAGENFELQVSTDNGTTWTGVLTAAGGSNLLFGLASTPVTYLTMESSTAWTSGKSRYHLKLDGITQFMFRFTATNNRPNENWALDNVSLTGIHLPLSSTWETAGAVTFDYENACASTGPYSYFISELPVPLMKDNYRYLKDSIFGGVLDSASYFQGSYPTLTHTFTDLPMGHYYVSVFDSRGELVYGGEKSVHPALTMDDEAYMTSAGNKFTASATDAKAIIEVYADETTRGGMEVEISGITGNQSYGFIETAIEFTGYGVIKNGFHVIHEKVYTVKNGVLSTGYHTAAAGSRLRIMYEAGVVNYLLNGTVIDTDTPPAAFDYVAAAKRDKGSFLFRPVKLNLYPLYIFVTNAVNSQCDDRTNDFSFDIVPYFFSPISYHYVVKDQEGATVASGTHSTSTLLSPNAVPVSTGAPGIYTLLLTSASLPGVIITKTVYVGIESDWTQVERYSLSPNSYSLKRDATSAGAYSTARSRNSLPENATGWVRFFATAPNGLLNNTTRNYLTFSNTAASGVPSAGETYLEFHYQLPLASIFPGGTATPAGVRMTYKNGGGTAHTAIIPVDAEITVLFPNLTTMLVKANGVTVATLDRPSGIIQLKANSNKLNQGFRDVTTSFGCSVGDEIYAGLKYKLDGYYHVMLDGKIRFEYEEEYTATDLKFNLYDHANQLVKTQADFPAYTTTHGPNMVTLDVSDDAHCIGNQYFYLEVINEKKEKFYLRFYNNYTGCN